MKIKSSLTTPTPDAPSDPTSALCESIIELIDEIKEDLRQISAPAQTDK